VLLADAMSSYWVNFATYGDPNGKGLAAWPAYSAATDLAMGLGDSVAPMPVPHKAALDFLDSFLPTPAASGR
ncbi:MAG: carboxylesterase family protein, partial [Candidatus Solibacter sp.]|nr:carboxylesterase family protein [Candidatus Solibacter sp.]